MPGDIKGLLEMNGVAIYAKETDLTGEHLRLLSTDALGALNVNTYAPIISRRVPLANTTAAYSAGHVIGAPTNPQVINTVSRANGHGSVIETLTVRLIGTNATPPDLDIYFFGKEFTTSVIADHAFPNITIDDLYGLMGVVQIRNASGHWTQLKFPNAGTVLTSVAMVTPFLSFVLQNTDPGDNACRAITVAAGAYTFNESDSLDYQLTIRQG